MFAYILADITMGLWLSKGLQYIDTQFICVLKFHGGRGVGS